MAGNLIVSPVREEIATVGRDLAHPYVGRLLLSRDDTLLLRGGLVALKLYDDLERDGEIYAALQKRKMALQAYPWFVDPASTAPADKAAADLVKAQLEAMSFNTMCVNLLDAILKGYAVGEIMWGVRDDQIVVEKVIPRDQRRFRFDIDYKLHLLTLENSFEGELLPDRKFVTHSFGSKDGNPYGIGLGTRLFWNAWFKRNGMTFWATYLDKFGAPTRIGRYPPGTNEADQQKLLDALEAISNNTGIAIPDGMVIELLEAQRSGSVDTYERFLAYQDRQINKIVLGATLTTDIGEAGSKAAADTHNDVRLELAQADATLLAEVLNQSLITWIVEFNVPEAAPPRVRWEISTPQDLNARAERDATISAMGFKPTLKYITDTYGGEWKLRSEGGRA